MALQLGPVGLDIDLDDPETYVQKGRAISLGGQARFDSVAAALAARSQLVAIFEAGRVIAVDWDQDTSVAGEYRPGSCSVGNVQTTLSTGILDLAVELERLPFSQSARHHVFSNGMERPGAPGGPSEDYWFAVSADAVGLAGDWGTAVPWTRTGSRGDVLFVVDPSLANGHGSWRIAPADAYNASPFFKANGFAVFGDDFEQPGTSWSVDNGFVHLAGDASHTMTAVFLNPGSPGSVGTVTYNIDVGLYLSATLVPLLPERVELIGWTEDEVFVDLVGYVSTPATSDQIEVACSLRLRRGSHHVEMQTRSSTSAVHVLQTGVGMTAVTVGNTSRATAADADTNRILVASAGGWTTLSGSGRHRSASTTVLDWALGFELAGASAVSPNTAAECWDNYWAFMWPVVSVSK